MHHSIPDSIKHLKYQYPIFLYKKYKKKSFFNVKKESFEKTKLHLKSPINSGLLLLFSLNSLIFYLQKFINYFAKFKNFIMSILTIWLNMN